MDGLESVLETDLEKFGLITRGSPLGKNRCVDS